MKTLLVSGQLCVSFLAWQKLNPFCLGSFLSIQARLIHVLVFMWWFHFDTSSLLLPHLRCLFLWLCVYWLLQGVSSAACSLSRFCDPACPMPLLSLSSLHLYFFHRSQLSSRKSLSLASPKPRYPTFQNKFSTAAWVLCVTRLPHVTCHLPPPPGLSSLTYETGQ